MLDEARTSPVEPPSWGVRLEHVGHKHAATTAWLALTIVLAASTAIDGLTGPRISMLLLYCSITAAAAWLLGRNAGITFAVAASMAGALVQIFHPNATDPLSITALNATLRVASLLLLVAIVRRQHDTLRTVETAAVTDQLTGLPNRERIIERLSHDLAIAARTGTRVAVAFCDLDELKATNDIHGHSAGDRLLVDFASAVRTEVRSTDLVGRIGGDEFVVVLPNTTAHGAAELLNRLCARPHTPSVSVGIAESASDPREDTASLLARADAAMYQAKVDSAIHVVVADSGSFGLEP